VENPILYVERIMWLLREGGVDEGSVRRTGEMLGTPVKGLMPSRLDIPMFSLGLLRRDVLRRALNMLSVYIHGIGGRASGFSQYLSMLRELLFYSGGRSLWRFSPTRFQRL